MGYRVKEIREGKKMTQEELEKLSGISRQTISAIENSDDYQAKVNTLLALAKALGTSVDDLFFKDAV